MTSNSNQSVKFTHQGPNSSDEPTYEWLLDDDLPEISTDEDTHQGALTNGTSSLSSVLEPDTQSRTTKGIRDENSREHDVYDSDSSFSSLASRPPSPPRGWPTPDFGYTPGLHSLLVSMANYLDLPVFLDREEWFEKRTFGVRFWAMVGRNDNHQLSLRRAELLERMTFDEIRVEMIERVVANWKNIWEGAEWIDKGGTWGDLIVMWHWKLRDSNHEEFQGASDMSSEKSEADSAHFPEPEDLPLDFTQLMEKQRRDNFRRHSEGRPYPSWWDEAKRV